MSRRTTLSLKERRIVRSAWRICDFPWPADFIRPTVAIESKSGFGYYDGYANQIVVAEVTMNFAVRGDRTRKVQVRNTILHEAFHALDYQTFNNEDRRRLVAVFHEGRMHPHAPADEPYPFGEAARNESNWTDHGHAWWDSNYSESLMEVSADTFVQAFSPNVSQTAKRWTHPITPAIEAEFARVLLEIVGA